MRIVLVRLLHATGTTSDLRARLPIIKMVSMAQYIGAYKKIIFKLGPQNANCQKKLCADTEQAGNAGRFHF